MTEKPIKPLICRMAVPTIVTMLITSVYQLADAYFAGQIGKEATAAIGVTYSFTAFLQAFSYMLGQGAGNAVARLLGARKGELADRFGSIAFFTAFFSGCLFAVAGAFFAEPLVVFLGATKTAAPSAMEYLTVLFLGLPFLMCSFVMNNLLRFQGNAFYGMLGIGAGCVLNILLDPILMFSCSLGLRGAALATDLGQLFSFFLLLFLSRKCNPDAIRLKNFRPTLTLYVEILRGGFPALCRQGLTSVAALTLNWCVKPYGDAALAAFSIVSRVTGFAYSALMGFGQGFQPVCGFNYGAGNYRRVREGFAFCVKASFLGLLLLSVVMFGYAEPLTALFEREEQEVVRLAVRALRLQCVTLPFVAVTVMTNMLAQTMGWAKSATVLSIARQGVFFLPPLLLFAWLGGLSAIYLAQPVADLLSAVFALVLMRKIMHLLSEGRSEGG